jgi:cytochrome c oxidase assembly protein subunit 15
MKSLRTMATATCVVALLPIGLGALVTTLKAGMAFADWPSSDGQNMLLYPFLKDFSTRPDKFVEHGHRLAGVVIGLTAVALAFKCWPMRGWVRNFGLGILIAVILQGLLGGARVLLDAGTLAMTHSMTGALFFSFCVVFRMLLSEQSAQWLATRERHLGAVGFAAGCVMPAIVLLQYFLGGMLRHLHMLRNEHIIGAIVTLMVCCWAGVSLIRGSNPALRRCGVAVVGAVFLQFSLGLGALVTRFGFRQLGYVSVTGSLEQAVLCSLHTVVGIFLVASSVSSCVWLVMLSRRGLIASTSLEMPVDTIPGGAS